MLQFLLFIGCDSGRRNGILEYLNSKYEQILKAKLSIFQSYAEMVDQNSARVLASYSYKDGEKPLRSQRVAEEPPVTDSASDMDTCSTSGTRNVCLPSPFRNISNIPDHDDFIQMVINAKAMGLANSNPASITWRGYTTAIRPNFELTRDNLRKKLILALQHVVSPSKEENEVYKYIYIHIYLNCA